MTNVEVRSLVARIEDLTTADFNILMEDEIFKKKFEDFVKLENPDFKSIAKELSDYANNNLIQKEIKMYAINDLIRDLKDVEKAMLKNIPINSTDEDQKDFYNFTIAVAINHCKEFIKQNKQKGK